LSSKDILGVSGCFLTIGGIEMITERAQKVWEAFCGELTQEPTDDMREALVTAVNEVADRLCTDWGELQHPADVLREIADELEELK
jgi:hypothetical protein